MNRIQRTTANHGFGISALVFLFFLGWSGAIAQVDEVGLRMDVDKREVQVGDQITLTIEFRQVGNSGSSDVQSPSIPTPEHFQITGTSSATQVSIVGQQTAQVTSTRLTLEAAQPGTETLGPAVLIFRDPQQKNREIKSNVITVTVTEKRGFSFFGHKKKEAEAGKPASTFHRSGRGRGCFARYQAVTA